MALVSGTCWLVTLTSLIIRFHYEIGKKALENRVAAGFWNNLATCSVRRTGQKIRRRLDCVYLKTFAPLWKNVKKTNCWLILFFITYSVNFSARMPYSSFEIWRQYNDLDLQVCQWRRRSFLLRGTYNFESVFRKLKKFWSLPRNLLLSTR